MKKTIHGNVYLLLLAMVALFFSACSQPRETKKVLLIHSYESSYEGYIDFNQYILDDFEKKGYDIDLKVFYLDCERFREAAEIQSLLNKIELLDKENWEPDIILVNEDQAHYSLLKSNHPWVHTIPIVFGGVNYPNWELLKHFDNVTGTQDKIDFVRGLEVAKEFMKTNFVAFSFIDSTFLDRKLRADIAKQLKNTEFQLTQSLLTRSYENSKPPFMPDGKNYMNIFPIRFTAVQTTFWNLSQIRSTLPYCYFNIKQDFASNIGSDLCQTKKFAAINEFFGYRKNIIAGYFTTLPTQAADEVNLAVKIFKGAKPSELPIQVAKKEYMADWFALRRWGIDPESLPKKYHIINYPFQVQHKGLLTILSIAAILVIAAIIHHLYRTRSNETAKKKQALLNLENKNKELAVANKQLRDQKEELIKARELAEKAELKQSFLANMSHEIRTPLNAIVGFANLLNDPETASTISDEERQDMINIINQNNTLLLKLISDVLDLSRIESGYVTMEIQEYEINKLVKEIFRTHEVIIHKELTFELKAEDTLANVWVDKLRFTQVIANFLSNANKFTTTGKITLGYYFDKERNEACVYVEDTGKGIEKEQQKMIFSRFYKTDEFAQGTGLGLSICQVIIQRLNGRIEVQSELGKGSRFSAFIPGKIKSTQFVVS